MKCQYCQTDGHECLNRHYACDLCRKWIFERIGYNKFDWYVLDGLVKAVWYNFKSEGIYIYFRYDLNKTEFTKWVSNHQKDEVVLSLPYILPITKELIEDIPLRFKTWMVFS